MQSSRSSAREFASGQQHHRQLRGRKKEAERNYVGGDIEDHGTSTVIDASAKKISPRRRRATFAVAADLVLVDGPMERVEGRFLKTLAAQLGLNPNVARNILDVIRIKNGA